MTFCSCDLDLDQMTLPLIYEFDLDILKTYLLTKNEVPWSGLTKVRARTGQTDRQTDGQGKRDRTHYQPHSWVKTKRAKLK